MWPVSGGWRLGGPAPRALAPGGPIIPVDSPPQQTRSAWPHTSRQRMVLKPSPSGEPCAALNKRKGKGSMPCNAELSHAWYAGPTCKNCYLRASTAGRNKNQKADDISGGDDVSGGDILLEVLKVCGSRCAPAPPDPPFPLAAPWSLCVARALAQALSNPD